MKHLFVLLASLLMLVPTLRAEPSKDESAAIEHLISFIAASKLSFIRNGEAHAPKEAAEHMRSKLESMKSRINSADDFIAECATKSMLTGQSYMLRDESGKETPSADMLKSELAKYRGK